MKTNNRKYIFSVCLVVVGLLCYGFIAKHDILKHSVGNQKTATVKTVKSKVMPPPETEIIGVWLDESEPGHKLEFNADGEIKIYSENVLVTTSTYEISDTCDGQSFDGQYLKIYDEDDGSELCYYINGIDATDTHILSISPTSSMHLEVYHKQ